MRKLNKNISLFLVGAGLLAAPSVFGQDLPPDAQPGQCFAKCVIPDEYETLTEQIVSKEAGTRLETIPATYATVEEQILVKEGYNVLSVVPPTYTTVSEEIVVQDASTRLEVVPAVYETVTEEILISPATTQWVRGKATPDCVASNPDDCRVWCLKEIPAKYKSISRRVLREPALTREVAVPGKTKTVQRTVVQTPATVQEKSIPPEYKTITKKVLDTPAQAVEREIPAEYKTITTRRLVRSGGFTEWREVLCDSKQTSSNISRIQQVLKDRGYDPGPVDGVMGSQTRAALRQFQEDNGLAVGVEGRSVPYETLKALGL